MSNTRWFRAVLILLAAIGGLWLLGWAWELASRFSDIILLFFLAWLVAFILYPLADALAAVQTPWLRGRTTLAHGLAVGLVYLGLILILVLLGLVLVPAIVAQAAQLGATLPSYVGQLPTIGQLQASLDRLGVPVDLQAVYQPQLIIDQARTLGGMLAQNAVGIAAGIVAVAFDLVLILILSFYFMLDGRRIADEILALLPSERQVAAAYFTASVSRTFGGFIRSQLIQAIICGVGTATVMWLAGLSYLAAVSAFSGLCMLIPFIGPFLALVPPLVLAATQGPGTLLWVFLALFVLQQILTNVIAPRIMSENVGLHPLLIFLSTLVGVKVAGFWGAIFGVPIVGVIYAMGTYFYRRAVQADGADSATCPRARDPEVPL